MENDRTVAKFMLQYLTENKYMYHEDIAWEIKQKFGESFCYQNKNGNMSISKNVLKEFRDLTPNVVWERDNRCWRFKENYETTKKRQIE